MKLLKWSARNGAIYQVLITIACLQNYLIQTLANIVHKTCLTSDCRKLADYFQKNMNEKGKPCTDFYDYVCHSWGRQNPGPKHRQLWNIDQYQIEITNQDIRTLLEDIQVTNDQRYERAKLLYRACMNLPFMETTDAVTIKGIMETAGNWPMFATKAPTRPKKVPWWEIEAYYINKAGESSFFDHYLIADTKQGGRVTLLMRAVRSPYGMLEINEHLDDHSKQLYKAYLTHVINSVGPFSINNSANVIDTDLNDVIIFRERINEIADMPEASKDSVLMTIQNFQMWYDTQDRGHETSKINWLAIIRAMYKNSKDAHRMTVQDTSTIVVLQPYFARLAKILGNTPSHVIENHIHLYFAERHLKLNVQMEGILGRIFTSNLEIRGRVRYEPEKWVTCVERHNMGLTLSHMYVTSHFPMASKKEVQEMLNELTRLLDKQIWESSWLDNDTKRKSIYKLQLLQSQIGFPDWYFPSTHVKQTSSYDLDPTSPEANYVTTLNKLCISAALLQWPIYMPNMPYVIKYGSSGMLLGHELYHAFDVNGIQHDEFGNRTVWWSGQMYNRFYKQADCFQTKYSKFRKDELQKRHITQMPRHVTPNEDIADVMGLKLAYLGYREQLNKNNGTCPILPGFEKYGCEQLFFMAFASAHCADYTPYVEAKLLLIDKHNLPHIRVNGAVGNMKEFLDAFRCKPNDPIVPQQTCDIWK